MADPRLRKLDIKTRVVKRLITDKLMYEKEAEREKAKLTIFRDQGKDEYEIKKQEELIRESLLMISDCIRRLSTAHSDLKSFSDTEVDLKETSEYTTALDILEEAEKLLKTPTEH